MRAGLLAALLLVSSSVLAQDAKEQRTLKNDNVGTITLSAPKDWVASESRQADSGATSYRLDAPQTTFSVMILFNDLAHMRMNTLTDKDLERLIEGAVAAAVPQSVEGAVKARRFGARQDGAYARLTDKAPKPGEFLYLTRGVRLLGQNIVLFTLLSNDRDGAALRDVLEVVDSVAVTK